MTPLIARPHYTQWLGEFRDMPLIKVITGLRRVGKSCLLKLFTQELLTTGVRSDQVLSINFESLENASLTDAKELYRFITSKIRPGETLYVFLDEILCVNGFEKILDSLYVKEGIDLYVTGSNAMLLSSQIATLLTGRYVEINVLPLSFREMVESNALPGDTNEEKFIHYAREGAMPGLLLFNQNDNKRRLYIENVFKSIFEKDIYKNRKASRHIVEAIIRFMIDATGHLTSPKRICDRINASGKIKVTETTVLSYIERLEASYFLYRSPRFDIAGGDYLKLIHKYYLTDFGFRSYILSNADFELQQILETAIYFELLRLGFQVCTGKVEDKEVDFVASKGIDTRYYIQVAVSVADKEKLKRELAPFEKIRDNYPRYVITLDSVLVPNVRGIRLIRALDFLMGKIPL